VLALQHNANKMSCDARTHIIFFVCVCLYVCTHCIYCRWTTRIGEHFLGRAGGIETTRGAIVTVVILHKDLVIIGYLFSDDDIIR
jgi:hypothetical protein